ncbi:MAG: FAD-binding oxidoreductase, partial [Proteobacteria bacterium]
YKRAQVWEMAKPYFYLRETADGRALVGGLDAPFQNGALRDALIPLKTKQLERFLRTQFPEMKFDTAYSWAGTFVETLDSLPYIGSIDQHPNVYFCCGFAGNGVTFSTIASRLIPDLIAGKTSREQRLFGFERTKEI